MSSITLSPAYGRDYKSKKAVQADFDADKDFIIEDIVNPYCGKPANKTQLVAAGYSEFRIRYKRMQNVHVFKV